MNSDILFKIGRWEIASELLSKFKEQEMELRKEIVNELTKDSEDGKFKGTIGNLSIDAKQKSSTSIEDKDDVLDDWDSMPPEIQDCFPRNPSFSKTAYKKLDEDSKLEVDEYLITKLAAPSLSIKKK